MQYGSLRAADSWKATPWEEGGLYGKLQTPVRPGIHLDCIFLRQAVIWDGAALCVSIIIRFGLALQIVESITLRITAHHGHHNHQHLKLQYMQSVLCCPIT